MHTKAAPGNNPENGRHALRRPMSPAFCARWTSAPRMSKLFRTALTHRSAAGERWRDPHRRPLPHLQRAPRVLRRRDPRRGRGRVSLPPISRRHRRHPHPPSQRPGARRAAHRLGARDEAGGLPLPRPERAHRRRRQGPPARRRVRSDHRRDRDRSGRRLSWSSGFTICSTATPSACWPGSSSPIPRASSRSSPRTATRAPPRYHTISMEGPAHQRTFEVEVRFNDVTLATGTGNSKRAAEEARCHPGIGAGARPTAHVGRNGAPPAGRERGRIAHIGPRSGAAGRISGGQSAWPDRTTR